MTTISGLRDGLATNLATISGLRTLARIPEVVNPPVAVVSPPTIEFDKSMGRGLDSYEFTIVVFVERIDSRSAESLLNGYAAPSGATSIKAAIESNRTLGGACSDLRVISMREVGPAIVGDTTYLTATFTVAVFAN